MTAENPFDLAGRVAIVTGGNGGLGLGIALGLAGAGANIVIAARSVEKTAQALEDVRALGVEAHGITVDVTQEPAIQRMVTDTIDHMGRLDILVNNSGIAVRAQPQDLTAAQWDSVVDVNLRAAITMLAPAPASPMAMPKPSPPLPPVTMATFPVRSNWLWEVTVSWPGTWE